MSEIVSNMQLRPCAACQHQHTRCDSNCELARYFPPNKAEDFKTVHQVYGVKAFLKSLNVVHESQRDATAHSLIIEAKIKKQFPDGGCLSVIRALVDQVAVLRDLKAKQLAEKERLETQIGSSTPQYEDIFLPMAQHDDDDRTMPQSPRSIAGILAEMEYYFLNFIEQQNGGDA